MEATYANGGTQVVLSTSDQTVFTIVGTGGAPLQVSAGQQIHVQAQVTIMRAGAVAGSLDTYDQVAVTAGDTLQQAGNYDVGIGCSKISGDPQVTVTSVAATAFVADP